MKAPLMPNFPCSITPRASGPQGDPLPAFLKLERVVPPVPTLQDTIRLLSRGDTLLVQPGWISPVLPALPAAPFKGGAGERNWSKLEPSAQGAEVIAVPPARSGAKTHHLDNLRLPLVFQAPLQVLLPPPLLLLQEQHQNVPSGSLPPGSNPNQY